MAPTMQLISFPCKEKVVKLQLHTTYTQRNLTKLRWREGRIIFNLSFLVQFFKGMGWEQNISRVKFSSPPILGSLEDKEDVFINFCFSLF